MSAESDLKGKIVVVTGSTRGIGLASARAFAAQGAAVVVNSRTDDGSGKRVVEEISTSAMSALFVRADCTTEAGVERLFAKVNARYGGLDILVNNVGGASPQEFRKTDLAYWTSEFRLNLFGTVLCCQSALPLLENRGGGRIINTSSVRGIPHFGREAIMAYSAAKAALVSFSLTLARVVAPKTTVNVVAPGVVGTDDPGAVDSRTRAEFISQSLLKREVTPGEIAAAHLYLARMPAITGSVLSVDGGLSLATP